MECLEPAMPASAFSTEARCSPMRSPERLPVPASAFPTEACCSPKRSPERVPQFAFVGEPPCLPASPVVSPVTSPATLGLEPLPPLDRAPDAQTETSLTPEPAAALPCAFGQVSPRRVLDLDAADSPIPYLEEDVPLASSLEDADVATDLRC